MAGLSFRSGSTPYRIVVRGDFEPLLSSVFESRSIVSADGMTTLTVDVRDSSHLDGLIDRFRDLGVDIVCVEEAGAESKEGRLIPAVAGDSGGQGGRWIAPGRSSNSPP